MSSQSSPRFDLPGKVEKILATLATYYGQRGNLLMQRLLVNSRYHVREESTYDNWNGGTYGHTICFQVPASIYCEVLDSPEAVTKELDEAINRLANVSNEFIHEVVLELQDDPTLENWRENSGALLHSSPSPVMITEDQIERIWALGYFRLFATHKATYKKQTSELKDALEYYGVSLFVAHEDIEPSKEWQSEIEKALFSMDALVALMTEDFSDSNWTDQEIGIAIGRYVPVIPVRLGTDPYGFIGKYQALSGASEAPGALADEIYQLLWANPQLHGRLTASLVTRFERSEDFYHANALIRLLGKIKNAPPEIIDRLERAPAQNAQVAGAYDVQYRLPQLLKRLRGGDVQAG